LKSPNENDMKQAFHLQLYCNFILFHDFIYKNISMSNWYLVRSVLKCHLMHDETQNIIQNTKGQEHKRHSNLQSVESTQLTDCT